MENISDYEKAIIGVIHMNQAEKRQEIRKQFHLSRLEMTFHWQSKKSLWGRFGGGWNWILGFEAAGRTIIFNLLICSLRFHWKKAKGK